MGATITRGVGRNSGRRRHRRTALNADINVTPLVDVMLVLLIGFYGGRALAQRGCAD